MQEAVWIWNITLFHLITTFIRRIFPVVFLAIKYIITSCIILAFWCIKKMCEKCVWKSDILRKDAGQWSLFCHSQCALEYQSSLLKNNPPPSPPLFFAKTHPLLSQQPPKNIDSVKPRFWKFDRRPNPLPAESGRGRCTLWFMCFFHIFAKLQIKGKINK